MKNFYILTGEGIECEKESLRFFSQEKFSLKCQYLPVADLLHQKVSLDDLFQVGDYLFLPGGFSFADHFGSGRLLAYRLKKINLFQKLFDRGVHLMGICNGFQVLMQAGLFGEQLSLRANRNREDQGMGFTNRWVKLQTSGPLEGADYEIVVRHGEGRVHLDGDFPKDVSCFLRYNDEVFSNGSHEAMAGLLAKHGKSRVWGMMPHPEIAFRPINHPDTATVVYPSRNQAQYMLPDGDGSKLMHAILQYTGD